ncbi:hypothetical protein HKX48_003997 [Thoreauomyces humboldtii]|nr:hypothetical protein HKX48_003997 [Thoreauomyces humboldtii]
MHPRPAKITKLAIQEEQEADMFDFVTSVKCYACPQEELDRTAGNLPAVIDSVMLALSAKKQSEVKAWEEETTSCSHTQNIQQSEPFKLGELAHCTKCELTENLWLCLTCGNLGCGRQQFGGIGGNGHGQNHHDETNHPVSVKIGTITPEGTADVYCYQCGEERLDPQLAAHLNTFGINIATQQKTQRTLNELQVEQNLKFDFSMTTQDGQELVPLFGPGLTGLKNLGNSCYMASVLQAVFGLKQFQDRYTGDVAKNHVAVCRDTPATCFHCQMAKMADGLLSGRYSVPIEPDATSEPDEPQVRGQDGIAPSMFKDLVGKGHPEFSTMRQQDAQEFFQHLTSLVEQKERAGGRDPSTIFKFDVEQRLQCLECEKVRYRTEKNTSLTLRVPAKRTNPGELKEGEKPEYAPITFEDCLATFCNDDIREHKCPHDKRDVSATFTTRFSTFPDTLVCTMSRFVLGQGWVMEKLNVAIPAPLELDLEHLRGHGLQDGESSLPEDGSSNSAAPQVDQAALDQLIAMGFPEVRCSKALLTTGNNGAEIAMSWLFEHMEDPDIDVPFQATSLGDGDSGASAGDIEQLMDMGFSASQAKRALKETSNNMERAIDWLFSHADSMDTTEPEPSTEGPVVATAAAGKDPRPARYALKAFVSHKGTSTHCGHYVAHVRQTDGRWVLFNDNKVVEVPDVTTAVGEAYIYVYERRI